MLRTRAGSAALRLGSQAVAQLHREAADVGHVMEPWSLGLHEVGDSSPLGALAGGAPWRQGTI